ncbi:hypothetical protein V6N13_125221 [Hibiscus sabdariffa]
MRVKGDEGMVMEMKVDVVWFDVGFLRRKWWRLGGLGGGRLMVLWGVFDRVRVVVEVVKKAGGDDEMEGLQVGGCSVWKIGEQEWSLMIEKMVIEA